MTKLLHVVGARPNFVKLAAVYRAAASHSNIQQKVVHTGQHYDRTMSDVLFSDLKLSPPDSNLGIGSGTHAEQTARVMVEVEKLLVEDAPDWLVVYGDVNSTLAATLAAVKLRVRVAHVEAGLRSFDRSMPEEINRILVDSVSNLLLAPSEDAVQNLYIEGRKASSVVMVGNVMVDTLDQSLSEARSRRVRPVAFGQGADKYAIFTAHRPVNVDDDRSLDELGTLLKETCRFFPVVFVTHPRAAARLRSHPATIQLVSESRLVMVDPMGYIDFLSLVDGAAVVVTDSGGLQEETTALGVPCATIRESTERPVTVTSGTNVIVGRDLNRLRSVLEAASSVWPNRSVSRPVFWDGHAGERVVDALVRS